MDDFYIKQETSVRIPEHQILISFNNDEDAEKFYYWFEDVGKKEFTNYVEQPCLIDQFFKQNPDAVCCCISCSCPKCSPRM